MKSHYFTSKIAIGIYAALGGAVLVAGIWWYVESKEYSKLDNSHVEALKKSLESFKKSVPNRGCLDDLMSALNAMSKMKKTQSFKLAVQVLQENVFHFQYVLRSEPELTRSEVDALVKSVTVACDYLIANDFSQSIPQSGVKIIEDKKEEDKKEEDKKEEDKKSKK